MYFAENLRSLDLARAEAWLLSQEIELNLPFYLSVDIRDSGYKALPVDANLFPAGFNNLHEDDLANLSQVIKDAVEKRVKNAQKILLLIEEHTRNLWYLENVYVLKTAIEKAGYLCYISTPRDLVEVSYGDGYALLSTATGHLIQVYSLSHLLSRESFDLVILNHDLIDGPSKSLENLPALICPSPYMGWHRRRKSHFFREYSLLAKELAKHLHIDSWHLKAEFLLVNEIDIFSESDRKILAQEAEKLLEKLREQYKVYGVKKEPFLFLKPDWGTYGMGVIPIKNSQEILILNRREKNRLAKGKSGTAVHSYLLQEGIPTLMQYAGCSAEICVYQVDRQVVGQFIRYNREKGPEQNLNSTGMAFYPLSQKNTNLPRGILRFYAILSRLSMLAAAKEALRAKVSACGTHEFFVSH